MLECMGNPSLFLVSLSSASSSFSPLFLTHRSPLLCVWLVWQLDPKSEEEVEEVSAEQ